MSLEFLAILSSHIPKPYESITRYYGWYSCRARGERRKLAPPSMKPDDEALATPSVSWASCMKRIFEINPLECPRCKGGMRVIAILTDEREILKIADALRIPRAQVPPQIPQAPVQEFFDELPPDDCA